MPNPPGLDLDRLHAYLDTEAPGLLPGPLSGELIAGGRSNLTYTITDGRRELVVRRPPLGHVLATAHDMSREYRVMTALASTSVPVPETVLLCADPDVLGAPFYLMSKVEGTVYRQADQTDGLGPARATALAEQLIDTLAALHAVDPAGVGLADFGRPEGFLARQVRRWRGQLDASRSREVPGIDALSARLAEAVPDSPRAAIVHGDYRLDNVLVGPHDVIAAVLDWEMATLGDPLTDLGLFVVYWDGLATIGPAVGDAVAGGVGPAHGFPSSDALLTRYAAASGLDLTHLDWYVGFGFFKLAVILEGIHYRFVQGQTVGEGFDRIGALVAPLVERGVAALEGSGWRG